MKRKTYVWDPLVRLFHWSLAGLFVTLAVILNPESALHVKLGYAVAALIAFRVIWGLIGSRHARFSDFPPSPEASMQQLRDIASGRKRLHMGHTPLGALMIYNLLLTIALIALTGWMMGTIQFFGVAWVEELHETLVGWAGISVIAHIAAVVYESRRVGVNLPKAMVTGYKAIPQEE